MYMSCDQLVFMSCDRLVIRLDHQMYVWLQCLYIVYYVGWLGDEQGDRDSQG